METLKTITIEELNNIIRTKVFELIPDGFINTKTKEVIPAHMSKLFNHSYTKNSEQYKAYYKKENQNRINIIKSDPKIYFCVQNNSNNKYVRFYLKEPYIRYKSNGLIELLLSSYEYTNRQGLSKAEKRKKKELTKRKRQIEKTIRDSISKSLKSKKKISYYHPNTNEKIFSLSKLGLEIYYNDIDEIKYVIEKEQLYHKKYSSYLEYNFIIENLPYNSKVDIYYNNKLYIKAVHVQSMKKNGQLSSLKILKKIKNIEKMIKTAEAEKTIQANVSNTVSNYSNTHEDTISKVFNFNSVKVEIKQNEIKFFFDNMNKIAVIRAQKYLTYENIVSRNCMDYIDRIKVNDTIIIYHNTKRCFSGKIIDSIPSKEIHYEITDDLTNIMTEKKQRKKWKLNDIKVSVNNDNYHFNYKDLNKLYSIRTSKTIDLGNSIPKDVIYELSKLSDQKKIFVNNMSMNCYELRFVSMLSPSKFNVEIMTDNLDKVLKHHNNISTSNSKKDLDRPDNLKHKPFIQKSNRYVNTFMKIVEQHDVVENIQLINSSNNHSTIGHEVIDKVATFAYFDSSRGQYSTFKMVLHYCEKCHRYFELKSSFEFQIKSIGLQLSDVLTGYYNDYMIPITFKHFGLNEKSLLGKYGYSVKKEGPSKYERQKIIRYILENHIMSKSEIKTFLDYLISFNGKKSNMDNAISKWQNDISYINSLVLHDQ